MPTAWDPVVRAVLVDRAHDLAPQHAAKWGKISVAGTSHRLVQHPVFGALSHADWGVLVHKHVDHHLRQFGA